MTDVNDVVTEVEVIKPVQFMNSVHVSWLVLTELVVTWQTLATVLIRTETFTNEPVRFGVRIEETFKEHALSTDTLAFVKVAVSLTDKSEVLSR